MGWRDRLAGLLLRVEVGREEVEDLSDPEADDFDDVEIRPPFAVAERYVRGEAWLHLHLRVRARWGEQDSCDLCTVVGRVAGHRKPHSLDDSTVVVQGHDLAGEVRETHRRGIDWRTERRQCGQERP